jgi:hypothetical protein
MIEIVTENGRVRYGIVDNIVAPTVFTKFQKNQLSIFLPDNYFWGQLKNYFFSKSAFAGKGMHFNSALISALKH